MFVDEAKVMLRAGNGGKGPADSAAKNSFRSGGDGGDGGKGGDVYALGDENLSDLENIPIPRISPPGTAATEWGAKKQGRPARTHICRYRREL